MTGALSNSRQVLPRSIFLMIVGVIAFALTVRTAITPDNSASPENEGPFTYSFHVDGVLEEASSFAASSSEYWWLDSGGRLTIEKGVGKTIQGPLPAGDKWRTLYARSSAQDTENGRYPQNLFRLVTQQEWENVAASARFRIIKDNEVRSPNRNESNGILLMSRYQDGDNLYYAGVRVDGHAVIKKKYRGEYVAHAEKPVFPGNYKGDNLLPHDAWIALKSEIRTTDAAVEIKLFMKKNGESEWTELLSARDTSDPILGEGHVGIRTDFMDAEFDDFRAEAI